MVVCSTYSTLSYILFYAVYLASKYTYTQNVQFTLILVSFFVSTAYDLLVSTACDLLVSTAYDLLVSTAYDL